MKPTKIIIWAAVAVVVAVLVFVGVHYINGRIQNAHDTAFDAAQAASAQKQTELEGQIADEEAARQAAIKQAQDAEAKAASLDAQRATDQKAIQAAQAQVATFKARWATEHDRYVKALAASNVANLDPCQAWTLNCEKSKQLGLLPADKTCLCHQLR